MTHAPPQPPPPPDKEDPTQTLDADSIGAGILYLLQAGYTGTQAAEYIRDHVADGRFILTLTAHVTPEQLIVKLRHDPKASQQLLKREEDLKIFLSDFICRAKELSSDQEPLIS